MRDLICDVTNVLKLRYG